MLPTRQDLARAWNSGDTNLESLLLVHDFFWEEEGYSAERPLIKCKDGGLMAVYAMDGLDPEPLGEEDLFNAARAVSRALDVLNPANLEGEWKGGTWEIQNIFSRRQGAAPILPPPSRASAALQYLSKSCNEYWQGRRVFQDDVLWTFKFVPRLRLKVPWRKRIGRLLDEQGHIELILEALRAQARMVRRVVRVLEETFLAFRTSRPRMDFGLRALTEQESFEAVWRHANRRSQPAPSLRRDLPLVVQVAGSERDNSGPEYRINGRPAKVLTWKVPPSGSVGYFFARLQNEIRFPFTLAQTFRAVDPSSVAGKTKRFGHVAAALAVRHKKSAAYAEEAQEFLGELAGGACPFDWYFSLLVEGASQAELDERTARLSSQMRNMQEEGLGIQAGEPLEEGANRVWAELASIPGNGQLALRENRITSRAAGDLGMVFRLSPGDANPFLLFGDRKGGVFSYSLFTRREPSWNKAVLGRPGSGKSMTMNAFVLGNAMHPSQAYVLDRGNSFGPLFELLASDMPDQVAVMRLRGGGFSFNPLPLVWALQERDRQIADGTYKMVLEDQQLPCPVDDAKRFFEAWIDALIGQGRPLEPDQKNRLDIALKGANGAGGFFLEFESLCQRYLREKAQGRPGSAPRPLSCLLAHLKSEAPELVSSVQLWTRAPRDRFFDMGIDSVASAKYIYFELSGLEDDPLLIVPFVGALMGTIWKRIQNPRFIQERKIVVIDEWWKFLAQPAFFAISEEIARTIRKFLGFMVVASQSPQDVKDGAARALLQCMSEKFLFSGFSEEAFMRKDLQLEDHHLRLHQDLREDANRREVYYVSGNGLNRVLSVDIPPALYWFATTDAEDKHWRSAFSAHFGGLAAGVDHLVAACDGRTVGSPKLRLQMVEAYARANGLRARELVA